MQRRLPILLKHEPLLDAIFEIRFSGITNLADLLGGYLYHVLNPGTNLIRLPAADMPQPMRANDPTLQFLPTVRIDLKEYFISIGDKNVIIHCKLPYPKWPNFKAFILDILGKIVQFNLNVQVERYSLKYVNIIEAPLISEQLDKIRLNITIGDLEVKKEHVSMQVHRREGPFLHILSIISGATGKVLDTRPFTGVVVDIDSIAEIDLTDFNKLYDTLEPNLEALRQANKEKFFGCLTDDTIVSLEPSYA